jgi:outer membrane protein assembly factor BamB
MLMLMFTACEEELPKANFELYEVELRSSIAGDEQVSLSWAPNENASPKEYYLSWTSGTIGVDGGERTLEPNVTSIVIDQLVNKVNYTFSVQPRYEKGLAGKVSVVLTPKSTKFPVTNFVALPDNAKVQLSWSKPVSDQLQGYHITITPGNQVIDINNPATENYEVANLINDQTYTFSIICIYPQGHSEAETKSATPGFTGSIWSSIDIGGYVKVSGAVFSPDGKTVYVPTSTPNGDLVAIDVATGIIKWRFEISTVTYGGGALVGPDGTIYQCGTDKNVYAINPNGTQKWMVTTDGVIGAFPALAANGTFYCITNAGTLYALNTAASGAELWKYTVAGANTGSAVTVGNDGVVYAGTNKGLFAFNSNGTVKWSDTSLNVTERGAMAMNGSVLYVALKAGAGVAAINTADGSVKWTAAANGDAYCPIVDKNGVIYFTEKGTSPTFNVYAVNSNGSQKWSQNIGAALTYDGLVLGDNGVVYGGSQGKVSGNYRIFGLNTTDGSFDLDETTDTHQIMTGAAIGPDKRLYLGTITTNNIGYLNAYDINAGLETDSWSVRGGNMQGTNCQK